MFELNAQNTALIVTAITALAGLIVELIRRHSAVAKDVAITREQVQNSHSTNLRDDLDDLHSTVKLVLSSTEALRAELAQERRERMAVASRLDAHLTQIANC